jgi:citrate synthase
VAADQVESEFLDAAEAASRLGVKPATLYAYVSRGLLHRHRDPATRRSLFRPEEVDALRRQSHPPRPSGEEVTFESAITVLGADRPYFRGVDALTLAGNARYEDVAEWLWSGVHTTTDGGWASLDQAVRTASRAHATLPSNALPLDRLQLIVPALAVTDPMRFTVEPSAVTATARALVAGMVDSLGSAPGSRQRPKGKPADAPIALRLWRSLSGDEPKPALLKALEAALVLLADHELAASTVAARVAASVRADPYSVVSAALGVLSGPMHGGASLGVERMLADMLDPSDASRVIGERLRRGERIPGAGHAVYLQGDGRAGALFDLLRKADRRHPKLLAAQAVMAELSQRGLPEPNIDMAVATLTSMAGMGAGSGEAIFAVARTAGWLAHALEEYQRRSPLRPRAVYVGPPPPLA